MTGLVKAVIEMSSRIQPAPPEEYVPMVKVSPGHDVMEETVRRNNIITCASPSSQGVGLALRTLLATVDETIPVLPASTHREVGVSSRIFYPGFCGGVGGIWGIEWEMGLLVFPFRLQLCNLFSWCCHSSVIPHGKVGIN